MMSASVLLLASNVLTGLTSHWILFLHHLSHGAGALDQWTEAGSAEVRIRYHFLSCTQTLISALNPASAYLDVLTKLDLCGLEEAITLQQQGS